MRNLLLPSMVACIAWSTSACSPPATTDASTDAQDAVVDTADVSRDTASPDVVDVATDTGVDAAADAVDVPTVDVIDAGDPDVIDTDVSMDAVDAGDPDVIDTDVSVDADDASADVPLDASDDVVDAAIDEGVDSGPVDAGAPRRVFVSSMGYSANLGGAAGADAQCQNLASAAGLGGTWMAWVSTSVSSPAARFTHSATPYVRIDGTTVAASWTTFASSAHLAGITVDEHGVTVAGAEVWTATTTDGMFTGTGCNDFTSNSSAAPFAQVGISDRSDDSWTNVYLQFCDRVGLRIYCVEQ